MKVIKGYGAPTAETIGEVNDFYVDLDTNNVYRCISVRTIGEEWGDVTLYARTLDNTVYTWEAAGGSSGGGMLISEVAYNEDGDVLSSSVPLDVLLDHVKGGGFAAVKLSLNSGEWMYANLIGDSASLNGIMFEHLSSNGSDQLSSIKLMIYRMGDSVEALVTYRYINIPK